MTEIEAKVKYVKLARSLQTYGVSFFLVKVRASTDKTLLHSAAVNFFFARPLEVCQFDVSFETVTTGSVAALSDLPNFGLSHQIGAIKSRVFFL